ncbi:MAG: anti-sigma factor antagonist [Actinobacteria bacterium]|nr:MAG: anti-sigma factor antagonist [Actinomycetota bacterium]REK38778.1 MAG: anti-sigma factor antagonist [Actinomycetota bacterium]
MSEPLARVDVSHPGTAAHVVVTGEIDISNGEDVGLQILDSIEDARLLVIDLSRLGFIDSQGIRMIHELSSSVDGRGIELEVVAPADSVAGQVLRLACLDETITITEG